MKKSGRERFLAALAGKNEEGPPIWMMRQAGRYHSHYQRLKEKHSFIELCKDTDLACEVTMGPIEDFDFDAAILFSDLLFPLEAMGMGLDYKPGPKLSFHLKALSDLEKLKTLTPTVVDEAIGFQAVAMKKIRNRLSKDKALLGFVGAPLTLYYYAVEGSHQGAEGELRDAKEGLTDGRFAGFCDRLCAGLAYNIRIQADAGADVVVVMDTCAGELTPEEYRKYALPSLLRVEREYYKNGGTVPLMYYSKGTGPATWNQLLDSRFVGLGVDWNLPINDVLKTYSGKKAIQGNFDPHLLLLDPKEFQPHFDAFVKRAQATTRDERKGWICGLGHGILPKTPEENVRTFMKTIREIFG